MGGRGSKSGGGGGGSGVDVTHNGETTRYYFSEKNGMNYYQRGVGGTPQPTPLNMTVRDFTKKSPGKWGNCKAGNCSGESSRTEGI